MQLRLLVVFLLGSLCFVSCKTDKADVKKSSYIPVTEVDNTPLKIPAVNADSIYHFIEKQVSFGPRVPGSEGHKQCKNWIVSKLSSYGASVSTQDFNAVLYSGEELPATNIIAQINPSHERRVLLSAHWDTRRVADFDPDPAKKNDPILGADDGGSGVGVILEIVRLIQANDINMGVDVVLFDAEDQGKSGGGPSAINTWCLGSQYWSRNLMPKNYNPMYGILLDMVGAKNPQFGQDEYSLKYAGDHVKKIWSLGQAMGHSKMFVNQKTNGITDDHVFVNTIAKIPMLDILNQPLGSKTGFQKCWHTHCDDMSSIDKKTIKAVGQVLVAALYKESKGKL